MSTNGPTQASSIRNLKRLFVLRNVMIASESAAILGVHYLIAVRLPLLPLFLILGSLALVNLLTWQRIRSKTYISDQEFFIQLFTGVLALAAVLYFTGGGTNPFACCS